jgi:hypothetical protein
MCNHSLVISKNRNTEVNNRSPLTTDETQRSAIAREDGLEASQKNIRFNKIQFSNI